MVLGSALVVCYRGSAVVGCYQCFCLASSSICFCVFVLREKDVWAVLIESISGSLCPFRWLLFTDFKDLEEDS